MKGKRIAQDILLNVYQQLGKKISRKGECENRNQDLLDCIAPGNNYREVWDNEQRKDEKSHDQSVQSMKKRRFCE